MKGPRDVDGEFELELIRSLEHLIDTVGMVSLLVVQAIAVLVNDLEAFLNLLKRLFFIEELGHLSSLFVR